jgi:hypothetical protein
LNEDVNNESIGISNMVIDLVGSGQAAGVEMVPVAFMGGNNILDKEVDTPELETW